MTHTFLFESAIWIASGTFWRGDGEPMEAQGRTEITHRPDCWLLSGTLKVLGSPPVEFVNAYCIEPPVHGLATMKWASENATLGKLQGTYSVIGSCIFSVYRCEGSGYHGAEHLEQLDSNSYRSAGVLLLENRGLSSWQMMLRRSSAHATPA
ncbi:MAG: hypothetical protein JWN85_360 [Gammaproteobacteria bacterium]|nr:hypothetical protein [Gammaproteobacteria bacterium]